MVRSREKTSFSFEFMKEMNNSAVDWAFLPTTGAGGASGKTLTKPDEIFPKLLWKR